jgi:ectoine hydroxylase-related dioxygenase (phytanoyl-CoA dioxygenase family)
MYLSAEEKSNGLLTDANLSEALRTLRDVGYVVIEDVYDTAFVDELRTAYDDLLERFLEVRGGIEGINKSKKNGFGLNHIAMFLPFLSPFADAQVVANPIAVQIMSAVLGDTLQCSFYNSNTAYPGSGYQQIHRDTGLIFGTELQVPTPPTNLVFNIPLTNFTEENGSTEVWPGTHLIVDKVPADSRALEERAKHFASQRTNISTGSIVIRDMRMWHRGVPNNSNEVRTMLAIVYDRGWLRAPRPVEIPRDTWNSWPEVAREIFRYNKIVESVGNVGVPQH